MDELKLCPFCGGKAKVSFKDYRFIGHNLYGDKKLVYRVQVICNRCHSRGKPVLTNPLVNPNPYVSSWWLNNSENTYIIKQTEMFRPYVEKAIEAWNRRIDNE